MQLLLVAIDEDHADMIIELACYRKFIYDYNPEQRFKNVEMVTAVPDAVRAKIIFKVIKNYRFDKIRDSDLKLIVAAESNAKAKILAKIACHSESRESTNHRHDIELVADTEDLERAEMLGSLACNIFSLKKNRASSS
jgi:hypothetical protein